MTRARFKHLLPLALLAACLVALWAFGLRQDLSWSSLARHQAELLAAVAARPFETGGAYVLIYIVLVACSVPEAAIVTVAGGLLFGTVLGGALAVIGASLGAVVLFLAARAAIVDLMAERAAPFMARIRPGIERDGFLYLLAIRLVPIFPFWLVNLAAAACGMRLIPFALATLLGIIPGTLVFAAIGAGVADVLANGGTPDFSVMFSPRVLLPLVGLAALTLLPLVWRGVRRRDTQSRKVRSRSIRGRNVQSRELPDRGAPRREAQTPRTPGRGPTGFDA
jgi:uncharacterized membrane protein YdjX (TVP38/TMEM64 family)